MCVGAKALGKLGNQLLDMSTWKQSNCHAMVARSLASYLGLKRVLALSP